MSNTMSVLKRPSSLTFESDGFYVISATHVIRFAFIWAACCGEDGSLVGGFHPGGSLPVVDRVSSLRQELKTADSRTTGNPLSYPVRFPGLQVPDAPNTTELYATNSASS